MTQVLQPPQLQGSVGSVTHQLEHDPSPIKWTSAPDSSSSTRQIRAMTRHIRNAGWVKAVYPGEGEPDAVPAVSPETDSEADVASFTLEVDGEVFALRPDQCGGTHYTWLNGPNLGYGFSVSPTQDLSLDEHRDFIRDFLAGIDPTTGYLSED